MALWLPVLSHIWILFCVMLAFKPVAAKQPLLGIVMSKRVWQWIIKIRVKSVEIASPMPLQRANNMAAQVLYWIAVLPPHSISLLPMGIMLVA